MSELERKDLAVQHERAVLVGVLLPDSKADPRNPLGELDRLARTAGARVVDYVLQRRHSVDAAHYIGSGKAEEIRERAEASDATLVIFDNDLSPAQIRDLEKIIQRKIIDRSELILDIFAARARTHQARLQVELAQLEYTAPRLRGMWTHLERIAGAGGGTGAGAVGGIGTRGPGERQIEIDRRLVSQRIALLKRKLDDIDRRRVREIHSRDHEFKISVVGYTNAGKSTLMNALTGAGTKVEDKLFATLDTKTRRWNLSGGVSVLLSDTVGFVRDLPHHLVASFRATLEESIHADLLFIVVDASSRSAQLELQAVNEVLEALECTDQPRVVLLNKMDALEDPSEAQIMESLIERGACGGDVPTLRVAARTGLGLERVHDHVLDRVRDRHTTLTIRTHPGNGRVLAYLDKHAHVLDRRYGEDALDIDVRIDPARLNQLKSRIEGIEVVGVPDTQ